MFACAWTDRAPCCLICQEAITAIQAATLGCHPLPPGVTFGATICLLLTLFIVDGPCCEMP